MPTPVAGTAAVEVEGDFRKLHRQVGVAGQQISRRMNRSLDTKGLRSFTSVATGSFARIGVAAKGAGLAMGAALGAGAFLGAKKSVKAAVDLGEQMNKTRVVFRGAEKDIIRWSESTARSLGISRREALEATGTFGNMLVPMGFARKEAGSMSVRMVKLAADMASFNNATPEETLDALRAGLAGETEPLRRFGVFLNDARLKQEAMNLGLKDAVGPTGALNANAKAQATYAVILKDTADAQGDFARTSDSLANQQRILKAQTDNIAASIGRALIPALTRGAKATSGFLNDVSRILGDKRLSPEDKLNESIRSAKVHFEPLAKEIQRAAREANLDEKFAGLIEDAVPVIAESAARAAPKAVAAFASAWANTNVWGKLLIGGFLLTRLGGLGAFRALGAKTGASFGGGLAAGAATTAVGGAGAGALAGGGLLATMAARLRPIATRVGLAGVGIALGDKLISDMGRRAAAKGGDLFKAIDARAADPTQILGVGVESVFGRSDVGKAGERLKTELKAIRDENGRISAEKARQLRQDAQLLGLTKQQKLAVNDLLRLGHIRTELARFSRDFKLPPLKIPIDSPRALKAFRELRAGMSTLRNHFTGSLSQIRGTVKRNMKAIEDSMGSHSRAGRAAIRRNLGLAIGDIRSLMRSGIVAADKGAAEIRKLMVQYLGTFGIKGKSARILVDTFGSKGIRNLEQGKTIGGRETKGTPAAGHRLQRGGLIPGFGEGDKVPVMAEPGEGFINKRAVRALGGRRAIDAINAMLPRFQGGGIVALGRELQREGYQVGEHPAFGGVGGSHVRGSYHYRNMALDVNADGKPGGEARWLDRLYRRLKGMPGIVELLWRVAGHFNHLHVAMSGAGGPLGALGAAAPKLPQFRASGPDSFAKTLTQAHLDIVRAGAQKHMEQLIGDVEGSEVGISTGGGNLALGRRMAARMGWTGNQWAALKELWTRESGWSNTARNPSSGAFGIPQALPPSKMGAAAVAGDAAAQIRWGLGYIKGRYGSPAAALAFHNAHNWYQSGGVIGARKGLALKGRRLRQRKGKGRRIRGRRPRKIMALPRLLTGRLGTAEAIEEVIADAVTSEPIAPDNRIAEALIDSLTERLRTSELRTAVSERQFDVLRNFPAFGGQFRDGGTVPGPVGAPRMIVAHGGETVTPPDTTGRLRVVIEDHRVRVFQDDVEMAVERVTRRQARGGARALPGGGGGLRR